MAEILRSRRLAPIVQVADRRQQDAAREFARAQEEFAAQERQLAELKRWWQEYANRLASGASASPALMREGRAFLAQLDHGIGRQQAAVERARARVEAARARWLAQRIDHAALEKVVGRFEAQERHAGQQREQREQDEHAARRTAPDLG